MMVMIQAVFSQYAVLEILCRRVLHSDWTIIFWSDLVLF